MIFRLFSLLFCGLFVASAALQYNDPDPWIWIVAYILPAILSLAATFGRTCFAPSIALAVLYTAIGLYIFPGFISGWFGDEAFREAGGLWIAAGWMAILADRARAFRDD
ncbi:MAG: transmembrane 220 family protein [bacterium]|nr:transmembrane 220 family protein [bacterium]